MEVIYNPTNEDTTFKYDSLEYTVKANSADLCDQWGNVIQPQPQLVVKFYQRKVNGPCEVVLEGEVMQKEKVEQAQGEELDFENMPYNELQKMAKAKNYPENVIGAKKEDLVNFLEEAKNATD